VSAARYPEDGAGNHHHPRIAGYEQHAARREIGLEPERDQVDRDAEAIVARLCGIRQNQHSGPLFFAPGFFPDTDPPPAAFKPCEHCLI